MEKKTVIQCKNGKAQNHCFCIEYNKTAGEGAAVLKSFPQPLTAAEEKYYVQNIQRVIWKQSIF